MHSYDSLAWTTAACREEGVSGSKNCLTFLPLLPVLPIGISIRESRGCHISSGAERAEQRVSLERRRGISRTWSVGELWGHIPLKTSGFSPSEMGILESVSRGLLW